MTLSVVLITHSEEASLARTLESVMPLVGDGKGEIIVVDSGSTDRTVELARSYGARVFVEGWKGYAAQKNSAIAKATGDWILSLDADESLEPGLIAEIGEYSSDLSAASAQAASGWGLTRRDAAETAHRAAKGEPLGFWIPRKNFFLGRWIKHGGFWPDPKLRLFRRGQGSFEDRAVHEDVKLEGPTGRLQHALLHHSYPTLSDYIDHMNRYSSLGAAMFSGKRHGSFSLLNILFRPLVTFIYNYFFRLGFLDGGEGLLLHLYHAVYVSWKYAKAWELGRTQKTADSSRAETHLE